MNDITFKRILQNCLEERGFIYRNRRYYYDDEDLKIVVDVQKSNYNESFYINYGFYIKTLHGNVAFPKTNECDFAARFLNYTVDVEQGDFRLLELDEAGFVECLTMNITKFLIPVIEEGIVKYFELYPRAIVTAKRKLKEIL